MTAFKKVFWWELFPWKLKYFSMAQFITKQPLGDLLFPGFSFWVHFVVYYLNSIWNENCKVSAVKSIDKYMVKSLLFSVIVGIYECLGF